ncbi:MAG: hypothetical protein HY958_02930 [Bacteroidia bacterium]|nr:hypothetical protein [Bacteroidia bacterium]
MKNLKNFVLIIFLGFSITGFADINRISKSPLQDLQKQRTDQYIQYLSLQGEGTDSLKIIFVNQLLETDNLLIGKIASLDSLNNSANAKINTLETQISEIKGKWMIIVLAAGAFLILLSAAFIVLFFMARSKSGRLSRDIKQAKKILDSINIELTSVKNDKTILENTLNDSRVKLDSELCLKNEIISNLESKFKDYRQNESSLKDNLNSAKKELDELKTKNKDLATRLDDIHSKYDEVVAKSHETTAKWKDLSAKSEESIEKYQELLKNNEELSAHCNTLEENNNEITASYLAYRQAGKNLEEKSIEITSRCNDLEEKNKDITLKYDSLLKEKEALEDRLKSIDEDKEKEASVKEALIADSLKLVEANKELVEKAAKSEQEILLMENELKEYKDERDRLIDEIYDLEDDIYDLKSKHPEQNVVVLKDLFEKNIDALKLINTKLSVEKEQLEKALRMREPENVLVEKINILTEENYNLQLDLEDEKMYVEKLHRKLDTYLDELEKQDLELELLNLKIKERCLPESRVKYDEMELNLVKIEKLNRLREMQVISDEEFNRMKINIISQI